MDDRIYTPPPVNCVGYRIYQLRIRRGLSQKELAGKLGISAQTLLNYEKSNLDDPGFKLISKLSDELNISPEYFFEEIPPERFELMDNLTEIALYMTYLPEDIQNHYKEVFKLLHKEISAKQIEKVGAIKRNKKREMLNQPYTPQ